MAVPNLDLGKDAAFVWSAYAASAAALVALVAQTLLAARRWRRRALGGRGASLRRP